MAIEITIDAEIDGEQFESSIKFDGTDEDLPDGFRFIEANADKLGLTAHEFVEATLRYLPITGFLEDEAAKGIQTMAIVYAVMRLVDDGAKLDNQDVVATLTIRNMEIAVAIGGTSTSIFKANVA